MKRALGLCSAIGLVLALASCASPSIEELGRTAIRDEASAGLETFTRITTTTDPRDRESLTSQLEEQMIPHSLGWDSNGDLYAEIYFREHLTRSGGFWAKQRTVSACIRYTFSSGSQSMKSVDCPDTGMPAGAVDEHVTVP